jgi:DNA mismatch repair protein MutL
MTEDHTPSIRILDPATINQIAAGEVIERPASVVKELVENAIDAGARTIRIELTSAQGAIGSIRVADDGCGMSPEDAVLAFHPHATSKIASVEDLRNIRTLGFRGEALASIAAVAKVTMVTKPRHDRAGAGTKVVIAGGEVVEQSETGVPEGTNVLVEDLFYNTPARKKFQKSLNTEIAHVHALVEGICIAHPDISFRLFLNRSEQLVTDRSVHLLDTIARIYGNEVADALIPVDAVYPFMTISGYISRIALSRKDHARLFVAVNKRYVSSPVIIAAVREGYGTLLPKDRFPVVFLDLTIDTVLVDVNVHPTKKQVRLSREKEIAAAVRETVNNALIRSDQIPAAGAPSRGMRPIGEDMAGKRSFPTYDMTGPAPSGVHEPTHTGTVATDQRLRQTELLIGLSHPPVAVPEMEVIAQVGGIYLIATTNTGDLILIDQHAAHERILYEQVSGQSRALPWSQELLVPVILHRSPRDTAIIRELISSLALEGLVIEEFGSDSFLVRAVPAVLGKQEETAFIDEMVSDLVSTDISLHVSDRERITRIIACRGAIKAGTVCTPEQCQRIVNQLRLTESPFTCPHGRPTMIRFTRKELDTMFKRT